MTFPTGKLPLDVLRSLLAQVPARDPRVRVGPQVGEDAAVIELGGRSLVIATDPITFAIDRIGRYAVYVNANDVAVMGARPAWFFAVLLLPEQGSTRDLVTSIMDDIGAACGELGVALCGGHTEITAGLARPIVIGQMIGETTPDRVLRKGRVAVGDRVVLTRGVAIEGTAVLARERRDVLAHRIGAEALARAAGFLTDPGISIVSAALAACEGDVHAMHDPTEGGLAGGLFELVAPSGLGLRIDRKRVRVFPETDAICRALGLDPLKLLASGALLIAVAPVEADALLRRLGDRGIEAADIGEVLPAADGLTLETRGRVEAIVPPERDEIARAFEQR